MTSLRRTMASGFAIGECITMEKAEELYKSGDFGRFIKPIDTAFTCYDEITVSQAQAVRFKNGGALSLDRLKSRVDGITRVYAPDGGFLGLGKPENHQLAVLKLF